MSTQVKVIVTGTKNFENRKAIYKTLDSLLKAMPGFIMLDCKGKGLETIAAEWADLNDVKTEEHPIKWKDLDVEGADVREGEFGKYNARAGLARNRVIVEAATHMVAFWNGSEDDKGTAILVGYAKKNDVKVKVVLIEGDQLKEGQSEVFGSGGESATAVAATPPPVEEPSTNLADDDDGIEW